MTVISSLVLSLALAQASGESAPNTNSPVVDNAPIKSQLLTVDASDKTNFVFLDLVDGTLVPSTETGNWIFGVRRYIFKTPTGVNGAAIGGAYVGAGADFEAFATCSQVAFEADESVSMLGYSINANALLTSEWFDYNDLGAVTPMDKFFAISRDNDCLKLKINTYATGVYGIEYQSLPYPIEGDLENSNQEVSLEPETK